MQHIRPDHQALQHHNDRVQPQHIPQPISLQSSPPETVTATLNTGPISAIIPPKLGMNWHSAPRNAHSGASGTCSSSSPTSHSNPTSSASSVVARHHPSSDFPTRCRQHRRPLLRIHHRPPPLNLPVPLLHTILQTWPTSTMLPPCYPARSSLLALPARASRLTPSATLCYPFL